MNNINIKKFTALCNEHNFNILSCLVYNSQIRFVEIQTPNLRKVFFVHVPANYHMKPDDNIQVKFHLKPCDPSPELDAHRLHKILPKCNVVCHTSECIMYFEKPEKPSVCFSMSVRPFIEDETPLAQTTEQKKSEPMSEDENDVAMEALLNEAEEHGVIYEENPVDIESDSDISNEADIEFEGFEPPMVKQKKIINDVIENSSNSSSKSSSAGSNDITVGIKLFHTIPIPPDVEENCLKHGVIMYACDLGTFLSNISTIETDVTSMYKFIDVSEWDVRNLKIQNVDELMTRCQEYFHSSVLEKTQEIKDIASNIDTLERMVQKLIEKNDTSEKTTMFIEKTKKTLSDFYLTTMGMITDLDDFIYVFEKNLEFLLI